MRRFVKLLAALAAVFLIPLSLGTVHAQEATSVMISQHPDLGSILTDASGRVLYLFTNDESNVSNCSGGCAESWPPLLTTGSPTAGEGLDAERLGTISRDDGSTQVTYNGWPLYYFANDAAPGDATGQDRGDVWYVVSMFGGPIQTNALINIAQHPELGAILVDRSGRTQYLFTNDERNVSNCSGGCALSWPPLLTIDSPVAGENLNAQQLGAITRANGSMQVTYNDWPLYYFASDTGPGDASGQGRGDVWFVVDPAGQAIMPAAQPQQPQQPQVSPIPPGVGDTAVPVMAQLALIPSAALILSGGTVLLRRRSYRAKR
jgi:predicted lipoprotein with Yx(FWY)xxD motif